MLWFRAPETDFVFGPPSRFGKRSSASLRGALAERFCATACAAGIGVLFLARVLALLLVKDARCVRGGLAQRRCGGGSDARAEAVEFAGAWSVSLQINSVAH